MSIDKLAKIVPPPSKPVHSDTDKWELVERRLKRSLPSTYREYAEVYGSGRFVDPGRLRITMLNPLDPIYIKMLEDLCDDYRAEKEAFGDGSFKYDLHPDSPGLLPWARDDNGNQLFWHTDGEAEDWPIVVNPHGSSEFETIRLPMTDFLVKVFSGKHPSKSIWRKPFFTGPAKVQFEPNESRKPSPRKKSV